MNKKITLLLLVILSLVVVACTAPPSDVPSATVVENDVEETEQEAVVEAEAENDVAVEEVQEEITPSQESSLDGEVPLDMSSSSFEFEGYAVGKSHVGTFDEWDATLVYDQGTLIGAYGTIQTASVNTGIGGLDAHLQRDDFFDSEVYPEITVEFLDISTGSATADLTFRGVTKTINFPVTVTDTSMSTDFLLDITDFDMKYVGVNDEVRIAFEFVAEQ